MNKAKIILSFLTAILVGVLSPSIVYGWFGAGRTPGWAPTTTGLSGEIALPQYKFSPDFYTVGDIVTINVQGFNPMPDDVTSHYYLVVSRVLEAPVGADVTDGDPDNPGLNENQLYDFHQAGNDVQSQVAVIDLGNQTFPASGSLTFGGSYLTTMTGYYQFDFMDMDPSGGYIPGHILAAGFFRVLAGSATPAPTPSPTPTATPVVSNSSNNQSSGGGGNSVCSATKPMAPTLLSVVKISATEARLTWSAVNPVSYYLISYGTSSGNYQFGVPNAGNTTTFTVGALVPGVKYYFVVRAVNDCTPSDPSNELSTSSGRVLGISTGQVLGASTMAATGSAGYLFEIATIAAGAVLMIGSMYGKASKISSREL